MLAELEGIQLLGDQVLIRMDGRPEKLGSVYLPAKQLDIRSSLPESLDSYGTVEAVGPGRYATIGIPGDPRPRFMPTSLQPGDRVLFYTGANNGNRRIDENHLIIRENQVQAVLESD